MEKLNIVRGNVDSDGNITAGSGFEVVKDGSGIYTVILRETKFSGTPTIVTTPISDSAEDDNTRINSVVRRTGLKNDAFVIVTGDDDGDRKSKDFGFIAVGPA